MSWFSELYDLYEKNEEKIGRVEYKTRQGKKGPEQVPVSYTHLDVYKRQGWMDVDILGLFSESFSLLQNRDLQQRQSWPF